jgi:hypothetical protein
VWEREKPLKRRASLRVRIRVCGAELRWTKELKSSQAADFSDTQLCETIRTKVMATTTLTRSRNLQQAANSENREKERERALKRRASVRVRVYGAELRWRTELKSFGATASSDIQLCKNY